MKSRQDVHRNSARLEARRLEAARWFARGATQAAVARQFGVSRQTSHRWYEAWHARGRSGLKTAGRPGPKSRLDHQQLVRLVAALRRGPRAHRFASDVWTAPRVATVIETVTGVRYHPAHAGRILRRLSLPFQQFIRSRASRTRS